MFGDGIPMLSVPFSHNSMILNLNSFFKRQAKVAGFSVVIVTIQKQFAKFHRTLLSLCMAVNYPSQIDFGIATKMLALNDCVKFENESRKIKSVL